MFLRFISPAVVTPALIDAEVPKDDETIKKGLVVIAKVIQGLANNMFFGKQIFMAPLNEFLKSNIVVVTRFLSELNVSVISSFLSCIYQLPARNTTREGNRQIRKSGLVSLATIRIR